MPWQSTRIKPSVTQRTADNKLRLIWATDVHVGAVGDTVWAKLLLSIARCNDLHPNAYVITGDLSPYGERTIMEPVLYRLKDAQAELMIALGNHDEEENTYGHAIPNTALLEGDSVFGHAAPFCEAHTLVSGDGTLKALCLVLDNNFYNDYAVASPYHALHQRIGIHNADPAGGYSRELGPAQLAWIRQTLAATAADIVLFFTHMNGGVYDYNQLATLLQADGRPALGFCGHAHEHATTTTITSVDGQATYTMLKPPAMYESGAWAVVTLSKSGAAVAVESAIVENYTPQAGWTINSPFSVPS